MFKIREFAEIAQVSASLLRYYDERGLFQPASIDARTGYRYYTIDQLPIINRILVWKELGLDLHQVEKLLQVEVSAEQVQGMLLLQEQRLEQEIRQREIQLARIQARMQYLLTEDAPLSHDVVIKAVPGFRALLHPSRVNGFQENRAVLRHLLKTLAAQGARPIGPAQFHYLPERANAEESVVHIALPLDPEQDVSALHAYQIVDVPAVEHLASFVHRGNPLSIGLAYQALARWIAGHGAVITGPCRKCCLRWKGAEDSYLTEIQYPIRLQEEKLITH